MNGINKLLPSFPQLLNFQVRLGKNLVIQLAGDDPRNLDSVLLPFRIRR